LRLRDADGEFMRSDAPFRTPQLIELDKIYAATRAVEQGSESEADLKYLQGKATSLGGLRPKRTVLDSDGTLALGKFPSITDTRSIVRGEVLALKLAKLAGLDAADARVEMISGTPVAIIRRFDRTPDAARLAYLRPGLHRACRCATTHQRASEARRARALAAHALQSSDHERG